jgi:hypothetical protein
MCLWLFYDNCTTITSATLQLKAIAGHSRKTQLQDNYKSSPAFSFMIFSLESPTYQHQYE